MEFQEARQLHNLDPQTIYCKLSVNINKGNKLKPKTINS